MGFDINGTTLTSDSGLVATYGGNQVMKMGVVGAQRYNLGQPMFRAGGTYADWQGIGTDVWATVPALNVTDVNVGTCYNTSNGRFTAPVNGLYLVTASTYLLINTAGGYSHPMFWVNGSATVRRPSSGALHRMRGHGITAGYSVDTDSLEIIPLIAGDYVEFRNYCGGAVYHRPEYGRFEGYLLF